MRTRIVAALFAVWLGSPSWGQNLPPYSELLSIERREHYSQIVCAATIEKAYLASAAKRIDRQEYSEWVAEARIDRIFKGTLDSQNITFKYYGPKMGTGDYFGPGYTNFQSGRRYLAFLTREKSNLRVTFPFYHLEIELASQAPVGQSDNSSNLALARELLFAIESSPQTIGRTATQYFTWVEELRGAESVGSVRRFLTSEDRLIRYQTAWWISFRQQSPDVICELIRTAQDGSTEEWARRGARDRLGIMGTYVTHCDGDTPLVPTTDSKLPDILERQPEPTS